MRKVTKKQFDTFLNYFQDKKEIYSVFEKTTTFFDAFDMTPLALFGETGYYIYD